MGQPIKFPNRIDHVVVMRIDEVRAAIGVAGQMELHDPLVRDVLDILARIEVVVHARNIDVVDVEQQSAIGLLGQAREEVPFAQR